MPLLAYIAGKPAAFTSKDHNFPPGETVEKQLIVINNSRDRSRPSASGRWACRRPITGDRKVTIPTGEQERIPLRFELPDHVGAWEVRTDARPSGSATARRRRLLRDQRAAAPTAASRVAAKIALFDPKGETGRLLGAMGVRASPSRPTRTCPATTS